MRTFLTFLIFSLFAFVRFVPTVFADSGIINPVLIFAGQGDAAQGMIILSSIISALVGLFLVVGFILAIFHFMFGAIRWVTASGDKTHLQNAQERMTQAVVGLILLAAVWAITTLIYTFLGWNQGPNHSFLFTLPNIEEIGQP